MSGKRIRAAALALALIAFTGCAYEEFDLLDEYMARHPEVIIMETKEIFGCEAELISGRADGKEITELYLKAYAESKDKGYVPVVVYVDSVLEEFINFKLEDTDRESFISSALSAERTDGKTLFEERYAELSEYYGEELTAIDGSYIDEMLSLGINTGKFLLSGEQFYEGAMYLVKVPAENPHEIFAWLPFCGWNDCPDVNDMMSMCEYWYKEYGAVPAQITHDTLTFYLSDPVTDKETAVKAAKEQFVMSSEVIGMGGIGSYVLMTMNSNIWTFWWD